ncbi:MAG: MATE family efflux transporter [Bacteroidales bacterium]|nr:MATE family efflux transporter [Bacteroidales bacterium]
MNYYHIRIFAAPATLVLYALTGWFIGMQNAKIPMFLSISLNLLNIALSLMFIRVFGLASRGIAWANLLSQYLGLLMGLFFVWLYWKKLKKYANIRKALSWDQFRQFIHVNKDIFIRTLCLIFTLSFFTIQSANTSDTILAVNTLLFQFFYFFSYFVDGFAYAAEALTGRYIGSRDKKNLHRSVRLLFIWATGIATLFTIVYLVFGNLILRMLTDNQQVLLAAKPYLVWIVIIPFVTFSAFVWDGIFVGATASKAMRNSMVIITTVIFLPAYYLLEPVMGNHGLWLAMMLFMGSRGIFLTIYARKSVYKLTD